MKQQKNNNKDTISIDEISRISSNLARGSDYFPLSTVLNHDLICRYLKKTWTPPPSLPIAAVEEAAVPICRYYVRLEFSLDELPIVLPRKKRDRS